MAAAFTPNGVEKRESQVAGVTAEDIMWIAKDRRPALWAAIEKESHEDLGGMLQGRHEVKSAAT